MRRVLLHVFFLCTSCSVGPDSVDSDNVYMIDCKTPTDEVKTYYISEGEYRYCYHWQSGIFDFKDLNGIQIKSAFCHVKNITINMSIDRSIEN